MGDPIDTSALDESGDCENCNGSGAYGEGRYSSACDRCNGSGFDPRAQLRATQTVGKLLERLVAHVEWVKSWIPSVRWPR